MECEMIGKYQRDFVCFHPRHVTHPPGIALPRIVWVWLNRLCNGVGRFRTCLYKWGMSSSAACECGAEEQTVDHVVFLCQIHRPRHGVHSLAVLNDMTIEWLLKTPFTRSSAAKQWIEGTRSND